MKLQNIFMTIGAMLLLTPSAYAETSGADLFSAKCAACHVSSRPSDISTLVAPPVMGVMRHVKMTYPTKDAAVKFIAEYALNPSQSKAVCMADKIKRFGLMPSQKGNVTQDELTSIAEWMYDNFGSQGGQGKGHKKNGKNCKSQ